MLFKVWLNAACKETLTEINIMPFSDERSLIQNFTQGRERNNCYTPKTELQSLRFSVNLAATSMILYLEIPYICSDFSFVKLYSKAKYCSAKAAINGKF